MHLTKAEETALLEVCALYSGRDAEEEFQRRSGRIMTYDRMRRAVRLRKTEPEIPIVWVESDWKNGPGTGIQSSKLRVIVPDSHGCFADQQAVKVFLDDLAILDPEEIVMLGDHVDVSGIFSTHQNNYLGDMEYSYEDDCSAANSFLDEIQRRAGRAKYVGYMEGNHEAHYERMCSRTHTNKRDAVAQVEVLSPAAKLRLKDRGIQYYRTAQTYDGLNTPGLMRRGKCYFTHGFSISKYATATHVQRTGACVVHGHTHRAQEYRTRTVASDDIGGWCPGTLSVLQPLYRHNSPTEWAHGYAVQAYEPDGRFLHLNIPIIDGRSLLRPLLGAIRPERLHG